MVKNMIYIYIYSFCSFIGKYGIPKLQIHRQGNKNPFTYPLCTTKLHNLSNILLEVIEVKNTHDEIDQLH